MAPRTLTFLLMVAGMLLSCRPASDAAAGGEAPTDKTRDQEKSPRCELRLELPPAIKQKSLGQAKVWIKNVGSSPVTLVMPGDGSDCRMRTPIVGWSLLPLESKHPHPQKPPQVSISMCGNVNPLKPDEVFVLRPGQERELNEWIGFPYAPPVGKYRVAFYYSNVPELKWSGLPLGKHDEKAMRRVKLSTPLSLVSNEVQVEIIE